MEKRLKTSSLSINNYGGGEVNIISQILVTLTHGKKNCQAMVQVQTGASIELLLGTDVLAQLGLHLLEATHANRYMTELLKGDIWQEVEDTPTTPALWADAPVFIPPSPSTTTTKLSKAPLQRATRVKESGVSPIQPSLLECKPEEAEKDANGPEVRVKLLKDTKIPAQHAKVVQVKIENPERIEKRIIVNTKEK